MFTSNAKLDSIRGKCTKIWYKNLLTFVLYLGSIWILFIIENWKHCSKIIFKCVNSAVGSIFNENFAEKRGFGSREQYIFQYWAWFLATVAVGPTDCGCQTQTLLWNAISKRYLNRFCNAFIHSSIRLLLRPLMSSLPWLSTSSSLTVTCQIYCERIHCKNFIVFVSL